MTKFVSEVTTKSGVVTTTVVEAELVREIQIATAPYYLVTLKDKKMKGLNKRFWKMEQ